MTMTDELGQRDFLRASPTGPIGNETLTEDLLQRQYDAIKSIYKELVKQNPSVLTQAVVQGTNQMGNQQNRVADQIAHEVTFQIGGKPVPIYKLFVVSTNGNQVINLVNPPSTATDGLDTSADALLYFPVELFHIYVRSTNATPFTVNGPELAAEGALFLWGFTTPDPLVPDWE